VFSTTHLSEIKGFVHKTEGMVNASMEFDSKTLNPLYRLRMGEPGQSHALSIAKKYGLPEYVINDARSMIGSIKTELDSMIVDLHEKRIQYEQSIEELGKQQSEVQEKIRELELMRSESAIKERGIMAKAYQEAADIISGARRQMHAYLDELKKKGRNESRRLLKQVETEAKQTDEKLREFAMDDSSIPSPEELKKGDIIFVKSLGSNASIVDVHIKNNRLRVSAGSKEIEVPFSDIRMKQEHSRYPEKSTVTFHEPEGTVPLRINLVGLRVEEALSKLERFLNDVLLAELREVVVIHGIGKGLLMKAVREHLDQHPLVKHYRSGAIDEGGVGVTIVTMK
jgi:DNA mismatch repair protein MutS2